MENFEIFSRYSIRTITAAREIGCAHHYHICVKSQSLRMFLKVCSVSCLYRSHREKNLTKNSGFEQKAGVNERTLRNHNCKPFAHTITNWLTLSAATIGQESIVKRFSFKIHSLSTFLWKFYAWLKLFLSASNFFSSTFHISGFCFNYSFFSFFIRWHHRLSILFETAEARLTNERS